MTHHTHHHHDVSSDLTFREKLIKLLEHWLKHNQDHAETYREWSQRAAANDLPQIGALLAEVGEMTRDIDEKFKQALQAMR